MANVAESALQAAPPAGIRRPAAGLSPAPAAGRPTAWAAAASPPRAAPLATSLIEECGQKNNQTSTGMGRRVSPRARRGLTEVRGMLTWCVLRDLDKLGPRGGRDGPGAHWRGGDSARVPPSAVIPAAEAAAALPLSTPGTTFAEPPP